MTNKSDIWDYIIDNGLASEEALRLVTNINGYNEDTLNDVIYSTTGYRDLEQLKNEES
jgi:hypothetical protein